MTIAATQVLAGITQGVSAVDAALDDGLSLIPELAILKPYVDALNSALQDVAKIAASKASIVAKLAAAQVALADTATETAETVKFGPKP
jgi:hypothetical protein